MHIPRFLPPVHMFLSHSKRVFSILTISSTHLPIVIYLLRWSRQFNHPAATWPFLGFFHFFFFFCFFFFFFDACESIEHPGEDKEAFTQSTSLHSLAHLTYWLTGSLAHSLIHSLTHSLTLSLSHSLAHSLSLSLSPSLPPSLSNLLTNGAFVLKRTFFTLFLHARVLTNHDKSTATKKAY